MRKIIWLLVVVMLVLHQDSWNWENEEIILGFMPVGLFYHVCLSIVAGIVWWLACVFAWPEGADEFDDEPASQGVKA